MNDRARILVLGLVTMVVSLIVGTVVLLSLYRVGFDEEWQRLVEMAQSRARLIEAVARFDVVRSAGFPGGEEAATLNKIRDVLGDIEGVGETGEFTLARLQGDRIVFLLSHRHGTVSDPLPVPLTSPNAEPMRRALRGESGTMVGRDYRGEIVLAAYEPVAVLDLGLVAKIDLAEHRAPFVRAGLTVAGIALLITLLGLGAVRLVGGPLVSKIEKSEANLGRQVTLLEEAQAELRFSEVIVANSTDMMALLDRRYTYLSANPAYLAAFGRTREQLIGGTVSEVLGGEVFESVIRPNADRSLAGETVHYDAWFDFPGSGHRYMSVTYSPCVDAGNEIVGLVVGARDITEKKHVRDALLHVRDRLQLGIDRMPIAYILWDVDGTVEEWNPAAERIFGHTKEDALGESLLELIVPEPVRPVVASVLEELARGTESSYSESNNNVRKDGTVISCDWFNTPIRGEDGEVLAILSMAIDITERRRAEQKIQDLNVTLEGRVAERTAELSAAVEELDGFSYSVSHDLKEPLRAIDAFSAMLEERYAGSLDQEGQRILATVRANTERMGVLIDELLTLSRIGRQLSQSSTLDMVGLVHAVFEEERFHVGERALELRVGELPKVAGDVTLVTQLMRNLIANAIKFTGPRAHARIDVGFAHEGEDPHFYVKDNGVGFDMKYAHKLFHAFERLHYAEEFPGSGVGLAIVKRIVERHGGRVWADSVLEEGATLHFTLPLAGEGLVTEEEAS